MEIIKTLAGYTSAFCAIATFLGLVIKPVRNKLLGITAAQEGLQCLLRAEIVGIYYRNLETKTLREYEYQSLCRCYKAYTANHGNSFVAHIFEEMQEWKIVK